MGRRLCAYDAGAGTTGVGRRMRSAGRRGFARGRQQLSVGDHVLHGQEEGPRAMRSGTASNAPSRRREITEENAQHIAAAALVRAKVAFVVPMTMIFFASYIGLTALAGF